MNRRLKKWFREPITQSWLKLIVFLVILVIGLLLALNVAASIRIETADFVWNDTGLPAKVLIIGEK